MSATSAIIKQQNVVLIVTGSFLFNTRPVSIRTAKITSEFNDTGKVVKENHSATEHKRQNPAGVGS